MTPQEIKFQVAGKHNLKGYICYEHLRKEQTNGGGIFMALKTELSPALVRDGGESFEAITEDMCMRKNENSLYNRIWPTGKRSIYKKGGFLAVSR